MLWSDGQFDSCGLLAHHQCTGEHQQGDSKGACILLASILLSCLQSILNLIIVFILAINNDYSILLINVVN